MYKLVFAASRMVVAGKWSTLCNESKEGRFVVPYNIRIVSTYPPRRCGIGTFSRDLATTLEHFTAEVGNIDVSFVSIWQ